MAVERRRVRVTGTVQGVGFRPFVYRVAAELGLAGFVRNDTAGVLIEAQGPPAALDELCRRLCDEPPPLARVTGVRVEEVPSKPTDRFVIDRSAGAGAVDVPVSVDTGTCAACLAEVDDPGDRRYGYPFTNCTDCGPRYTIVRRVPYDRPATTMAGFAMCPECQREYDDPTDRRFHAQPNACPRCGPRLRYTTPAGEEIPGDALAVAAAALRHGQILAVKGIGGYHLAVDATAPGAVAELRRRKARDDKPFAVMVRDLAAAAAVVELGGPAAELLTSPRRPIVLAPKRVPSAVAEAVAPGLPELGVMLPYSPLHHLLAARLDRPLVLTSGNLSDEPIAHVDDDARARLGPLVDGVLAHDRPIHIRCDDSVVRSTGQHGQVLRRSRGYAPEPLPLGFEARRAVLALGAELKSTVAVTKGATVIASHHIGDLEHLATYRSFLQAVEHLCHLFGVTPDVVAHDLHPEYLSTKLAAELDLPAVGVQHHHAHVASCLVDHGRAGPVVGVAYDGLGYGPDGTFWGGEILVADLDGFERAGHLRPVALPGGAAAIREPWRMAVAWIHASLGPDAAAALGARLDPRAADLVHLIDGAATTTSVGRLFDAVAALVTRRTQVTYEGQAAIELEALAGSTEAPARRYPFPHHEDGDTTVLDPAPLVAAVVEALDAGAPPAEVAAAFHQSVAAATAEAAAAVARSRDLGTVVLSGGVWQNARLAALVASALREGGLEVLTHERIPPGDGGISIGQAAVAAHRRAVG